MDDVLDMDTLQGWIGREEIASERLTAGLVDRFAATLGVAKPEAEAFAPRLIHLCLAPSAAANDALGPDGHPVCGGFLPPVPLPNRMWAGGEFSFHHDLTVGQMVTRRSTIRDVVLKEGRAGPLCFVTVDHAISDGEGVALEERQDIVYLDAASARKGGEPDPAAAGRWKKPVVASPVALFRYSAITFNSHRIHYDEPYATGVEGYPGLVVHGPLQATWLYHFAAEILCRPPARFSFRSSTPLFDIDRITLHAVEEGDGLRLWTAAEDGPVAMSAFAGE